MKKVRKILSIILTTALIGASLVGCGSSTQDKANDSEQAVTASSNEKKDITFGVAPGPYGDMVKLAIQPELEKKGYKVKITEFSDYVQPNIALSNKEIDVNVFQHQVYLDSFAKEHNLNLVSIKNIPTASMGIFSKKYKKLDELKDGDTVSLPNDVPNLARGLRFLQQAGVITLKKDVDLTKVSEKDIDQNPKNLKFTPVEAAQLPRTLESSAVAIINGNYAISSGLSLSSAVAKEKLTEEYKNVIAIRTEDKDSQFAKDILEIVQSEAFKKVILDDKNIFKDFDFPDWFKK